jgi:Zn finger protein HypA/HybF involved in hydrogenase expression
VIYDDSTEVYRSEFRCRKCRSRLKLTNIHRLKRTICPACGKKTFQIDNRHTVLWD